MPSTLKTIKVPKTDADGKVLQDAEGNAVLKNVADRFMLEIWIKLGHSAVEPEAYAHVSLTGPARGALPAQEYNVPIAFTLSDELKALMLAEAKAAVKEETDR